MPMMDNYDKLYALGRAIFNRRRELGLSQNQLAERLDISREHLAKIETAKRAVSLPLLINISIVLKTKVKALCNF